jgi:Domain of unknown function (DUF4157)
LYGYANGDPINFSDPFGLCAQSDTGRALTKAECDLYADQCAQVDCDKVRVHENDPNTADNTMKTKGYDVYVGKSTMSEADRQSQLAHELVHVVQWQQMGGFRYGFALLRSRMRGEANGFSMSSVSPSSTYGDFGIEGQGYMTEYCFDGVAQACKISPYRPRR